MKLEGSLESGCTNTGRKWSHKANGFHEKSTCIQRNRTQQIRAHRPCNSSKAYDWSQATVINREPDQFTRCIKEAVHIRMDGQAMNRDEDSYQTQSRRRPLS